MNDNQWIKELKNGNPDAFKNLVELHQEKVLNICYRFLKSREDAEEITQEVFIEVYKSISRFRGASAISTWIYRIAVTKSLDYLRKMKRKKRISHVQKIFGLEKEAEQVAAPSNTNPSNNLEEQERHHVLQQAVQSLPENQGAALILSTYDGFNYNEIAGIMGVTVPAVQGLVHRAKKNLKKKLRHYYCPVAGKK